jgi:hypothetical protein
MPSGTAGAADQWSTSAAWFDADNDGDLDLYVCNYVQWSRATDLAVHYQLPGVGKAYGPPFNFAGSFPCFFRNEGQGRFLDRTRESGMQLSTPASGQPWAKSLGVTPVDVDEDGWLDLVVANDTVQNFVFRNRRDGTFEEIAASAGIAFDSYGGTRGAMGIDAARSGGANELSIAIGNFANEMTALYVSQNPLDSATVPAPLQFADQAIQHGIGSASRAALTFGVFFFDYDLDGWEDLLTVNGHIEPEIHRFDPTQLYRQPPQLFWNAHGPAHGFVPVSESQSGPDLFQPMVGRGSAFADVDGDGDPDIVLTQIAGPARLLRNDLESEGHWIRLKLAGTRSNRDAIGARLRLVHQGRTQWRRVMPTRGYLSQSELPVTFGLGASGQISSLEIHWPGGRTQNIPSPPIHRMITVREN